MTYSKKQMMPLIEKYGINPETNQLFINICEMFDGQPNYQLWGVKVIFSKATTMPILESIKTWSDENQQLVKKLSKQNVIPYGTKTAIGQLRKEIANLNKISFVKSIIDTFNTEQRNLLNKFINMPNLTSLNLGENSSFRKLFNNFEKFANLSSDRKINFIKKNSAIKDINTLLDHINEAVKESYEWNREDLLAYVKNNTPDCDVVYDNGKNIVILQVKSFKSSAALCAGGRTQWCITTSDGQWNNYVVNNNNKQFFFFDFSKDEKDELAHIGFTVSDKSGIIHAHSTTDRALVGSNFITYGKKNEHVNIQKAFKMAQVSYSSFMPKKDNVSYKWDKDSCEVLMTSKKHDYALAYNKNNIIIAQVLSRKGLSELCQHTYINLDTFNPQDSTVYVLCDFNLPSYSDNAILVMEYAKDQYGTLSLSHIFDAYGADITHDKYLNNIGIHSNDYLERVNISPDILLHKLIDEDDEQGAITLIRDNMSTIDINYSFNGRIPVYNAMQHKMFNLMSEIMSNDNFKTIDETDEFAEPLFNSLLYYYCSDELTENKDDEAGFQTMINAMLSNPKFDFNNPDLNNDSAINICCEFEKLAWVAMELIHRPETDVNVVNDFDFSALTNAIRNKNKEVLRELGKRPDLIVRDIDKEIAKDCGINLDDYIKPVPMVGLEKIERKTQKKHELDFTALFERALAACR